MNNGHDHASTGAAAFSALPWDRRAAMMARNSRQSKARPSSSCIPCRNRKVKCNRLDPCEACITRGQAHECKYNANEEDRQSIAQADVIDELRSTVKDLRSKLSQLEADRHFDRGSSFSSEEGDESIAEMEIVYAALQMGDPDVVQQLVALLRNGVGLGEVRGLAEQVVVDGGESEVSSI